MIETQDNASAPLAAAQPTIPFKGVEGDRPLSEYKGIHERAEIADQQQEQKQFEPPFPQKMEDLDVAEEHLANLALKIASLDVDCTTASISSRIGLGLLITDTLLQRLYKEKYIEKKGVVGLHNNRYCMLERGWDKVAQLMGVCSYTGVAPVSLSSYTNAIAQQVSLRPSVTEQMVVEALEGLVLSDRVKQVLGLVISSGRSLFLSGPPGNGKTTIARALVHAIPWNFFIPYAIEIDGQIIRVFDSHNHRPIESGANGSDRRWVKIHPPLVVVGGELTLDSLELTGTDTQRFYEAPFHLKSNGGVLLIDDFGRQRCSAKELINRWIVPLENRFDFLTLSTGKKIQIPFEQIVVFATNLTQTDLTDEAFMRRMGYRLDLAAPSADTFEAIFMAYAAARQIPVDHESVAWLIERYQAEGRTPKSCDPRDLIERAADLCKYKKESVRIDEQALDIAWRSYFGEGNADSNGNGNGNGNGN